METIISPASAGRAGKAVQNDSGRKTVRNSLRSGRNRWKHLCALRVRPASSEKRRSTGSGRTNDQRGSCKQILRGGHWTYLRICRSGIKEFCESRRLTGRLFSHSLPLVAPIRLSMPPAGVQGRLHNRNTSRFRPNNGVFHVRVRGALPLYFFRRFPDCYLDFHLH